MLWALIMTITVPGHEQRFVVDQFANTSDCVAALKQTHNTHYHGVHSTFACEKQPIRRVTRTTLVLD